MLLNVNNLAVSFGGVHALDLQQFSLRANELRVIIGPNGAGKSTFLDLLCGKTRADRGTIVFNGERIDGLSEVAIAKKGIARKFQKPSVFPSLTVYDNLLLAAKMDKGVWHSLFFRMTAVVQERLERVADRVGLLQHLQQPAGTLSHGQKQWLEIALVILQDPPLMLIDEPAAGLSDEETFKTGELLLGLSQQHALIVIEHDMHFVKQIAKEKVNVFTQGKLLMEGTYEEVRNDQRVIDSYLGRANAKLEML